MRTQEAIKIIKNEYCSRCDAKFICNGCYIGKAIEALEKQAGIERSLERLEKELKLADEEKERCSRENQLQFDSAKGYATGIYNAIEIIKEEVFNVEVRL